jgi:hypothetical protein
LPVTILVLLVLPLLLGVTWFLNYRVSGNSAVQKLEAKIKARGEPLTLSELAATYPPIPDSSNGVVAILQEWKKEWPAFWQAFEDGAKSLPDHPLHPDEPAIPFLSSEIQTVSRLAVLQPTNLTAAEEYVRENKDHIEAIRVALRYPQFRYPVVITNGYEALLPHLSEVKHEAWNFRVVGLLAVEHGDVEGALNALEDTARLGDTLADEPFLISQLVRLAAYTMVIEDAERLLSRHTLSANQLEKVDGLLNREQTTGTLRKVLMEERAAGYSLFHLSPDALARSTGILTGQSPGKAQLGLNILSALGLRDADEAFFLETFEQAIPLADRDDPAAMQQYVQLFRNVGINARKFPPKIFSAMLLPAGEALPQRFARFEGRRRAAVTAIAVERFRLAHDGHLPGQLDDLKPQFLPAVAKDPFDGQPIRFKPLTNGYVVYSIGVNGVDDGGRERTKKYSTKDCDETFTVER